MCFYSAYQVENIRPFRTLKGSKSCMVSTSVESGLVPLIPLASVLVFDLYVEGAAADVLVFTMRNVIMAATWAATTRMLLAA